jgi:hypothetical protein
LRACNRGKENEAEIIEITAARNCSTLRTVRHRAGRDDWALAGVLGADLDDPQWIPVWPPDAFGHDTDPCVAQALPDLATPFAVLVADQHAMADK